MDFTATLRVLLRRWYVVIPALVVSLGVAAIVFESVPAKYTSTGTVLLLGPSKGATGGADTKSPPINPLVSIDGSLTTVATALYSVLQSPSVVNDLAAAGATADYEVGDGKLGGPFINVVSTGKTSAEAQRTVTAVLQRAATELRKREQEYDAPAGSYIQFDSLVQPTESTKLNGSKVRAAGAALALTLAVSIGAAFMAENIGENRRARRRREMGDPDRRTGGDRRAPVRQEERPAQHGSRPPAAFSDETAPISGLPLRTRN